MRSGVAFPAVLVAVAVGCASTPELPAARFANAPAVRVVDDRRDTPRPPHAYRTLPDFYFFNESVELPITRALELPRHRRALGVNALDEVPDSTWFTNRIGVRALAPDEVRRGPVRLESPELHLPWRVVSTKIGGTQAGLIVTDARGVKYMIKFDDVEFPELQSGTHVIVNRLLWAAGYNVPQDEIVFFRPRDLVLAPTATVKDVFGGDERRLGRGELERELAGVPHERDGRIRALASRWLDGKPLGGPPPFGLRPGDPNDRIPHEMRRDLRGEIALAAWLDMVDTTRGNYLDMWTTDPRDPRRHYVVHYQIDFGKSLGAMGSIAHDPRRGRSFMIDYERMFEQLGTLGIGTRPWGHHFAPALRGVASMFVADGFDPGAFRPDLPYAPFLTADRFDGFWGAKIVARFTPAQLHAAVEAARLSDPRATQYLVETLLARQREVEAYWFSRVNPLDGFAIQSAGGGVGLCFDDLAIEHALAPPAATHYTIASYDVGARPGARLVARRRIVVAATATGQVCTPALPLARGYTILKITTARPGFSGTTYIHVAPDPATGVPRVIGIWRT